MTTDTTTEANETFRLEGGFFKARPATEGDERFVFCEPSNENRDIQDDCIMQEAVVKAWPHYHKFGNVDLDHLSLLGPKLLGLSLEEARSHEIGLPDALVSEKPAVVKCKIYRGEGPRFEKSNGFWEDLTVKGRRFYPSIAGDFLPGERTCANGACIAKGIVWNNIGFASLPFLPVNRTVKAVALSQADFAKALSTTYATDSATLSGADAFRRQSLHGKTVKVEPGDDAELDAPIARYLSGLGKAGCAHMKAAGITGDGMQEHFEKCEGMTPERAIRAKRRLAHLVTTATRNHPHRVAQAA